MRRVVGARARGDERLIAAGPLRIHTVARGADASRRSGPLPVLRDRPPSTRTSPPCVSAVALVTMLITPFTALAPHMAAPGPRITSIRSMSSSIRSSASQNTPGEDPVVEAAAVDEDEQLVRVQAVEPAHRHGPFVRVDLRDLDAWHQPEQVGNCSSCRSGECRPA